MAVTDNEVDIASMVAKGQRVGVVRGWLGENCLSLRLSVEASIMVGIDASSSSGVETTKGHRVGVVRGWSVRENCLASRVGCEACIVEVAGRLWQ